MKFINTKLFFWLFIAVIYQFCVQISPVYSKDKPYIVKLVMVGPEGSPWGESAVLTKKHIEERTNKKVKVKLYLGGILGDENSTIIRLKNGGLNFWAGSAGAIATVVPELNVLELPFLFLNNNEIDKLLYDEMLEDIESLLRSYGIELFASVEVGWRHFATSKKPIRRADDLKGLKMRSQQNKIHIKMWELLGANPIPFSITEVVNAFNAGVIEGFDNTPTLTFATGWFQHIKYYTMSKHLYQPGFGVFNKKFLDDLPKELRDKLMRDRKTITKKSNDYLRNYNKSNVYPMFKQLNIELIKLNEEERAKLKAKLKTLYSYFLKSTTPTGKKMLGKILIKLDKFRNNNKSN